MTGLVARARERGRPRCFRFLGSLPEPGAAQGYQERPPVAWVFFGARIRVRRAVAQLGSALDWGSKGRRFKSCQLTSKDPDASRVFALVLVCTAGFGRRSAGGGALVPVSPTPQPHTMAAV